MEDGAVYWAPLKGRTLGEGSREIDLGTLRGSAIWWGPWVRRFARSRVRVELERQQLRDKPVEHGLGMEVDRVLAGLTAREKQVLESWFGSGSNGDRQLRVIRTFAPPRGYTD